MSATPAIIAVIAANKRRQELERQKQIDLINQGDKTSMECYNHPNTKVVGICGSCYKSICRDCAPSTPNKLLCSSCTEKIAASNPLGSFILGVVIAIVIFLAMLLPAFLLK